MTATSAETAGDAGEGAGPARWSVTAPAVLAGYHGRRREFVHQDAGPDDDAIRMSWHGSGAVLQFDNWQFGDLDFVVFSADRAVEVSPTRSRAQWAGIVVGMCLAGTVEVSQAGRTVQLGPSGFTFYRSDRPYRVSSPGAHSWLVCRLRVLRIGLGDSELGDVLVQEVPMEGTAGGLLASLLRQATAAKDTLSPRAQLHCADAIHSMVRAVIDDASTSTRPRTTSTPFHRYTQWLEERIAAPDLGADEIAATFHVSVRHVRDVFRRNGITVSTFVRQRRLEHLRQDLIDPDFATQTFAWLAHRWGLGNTANANRLFREQYGSPPATYRRTNLNAAFY